VFLTLTLLLYQKLELLFKCLKLRPWVFQLKGGYYQPIFPAFSVTIFNVENGGGTI